MSKSYFEDVYEDDIVHIYRDTRTQPHLHNTIWIWDKGREINLAMGAKTERAAFLEVVEYYQNRLNEVETSLKSITSKVESFVEQVTSTED